MTVRDSEVRVLDADGKVTNWRGEGGNLSTLMRRGWRKDSLKVGETITIEGSGSKTGQPFLNARTVTRPARRLIPYTTPLEGVYLCSSATPPGGGVHGLNGYAAAKIALRRLKLDKPSRL